LPISLVNISQWILKYIFNIRMNDKKEAFNKVDLEHFFQQTKEQDEENPELNTELFATALSLPMVKSSERLVLKTENDAIQIQEGIWELKKNFTSTTLSQLVISVRKHNTPWVSVHPLDQN